MRQRSPRRIPGRPVGWAAAVVLLPWVLTATASAGVSIFFSGQDANPAAPTSTATVAPGGTFPLDVFINESATTDRVSGVDYRLQVSANGVAANGVGYFTLAARTSTAVYTPEVADGSPNFPLVLSPSSGSADLGGDRNGAADLTGVNTYELADYTLRLSNGTPVGTYTVSFLGIGTNLLPTYGGSSANNYPTMQFASEGTFVVTVAAPEPSSGLTLLASGGSLLTLVRRRRRR